MYSQDARKIYADVLSGKSSWQLAALRIMILDFAYYNTITVEATATYIKANVHNYEKFLQKIEDIYALRETGFKSAELNQIIENMFLPEEKVYAAMVTALCSKEQFQQVKTRVLRGV